jgi:adenosylmethionine---8-amino-7-oxononanoate aminotransferase
MTPSLSELDYRHLWHPYTDITAYERGPFLSIERAEGIYLYDQDGRAIMDGIASWWACALGHSHPRLVKAIQEQAAVLQHSILGKLTHPKAIELAARLAALAPGDLNHVYFACDGSSAVEAALKMVLQYWVHMGRPHRKEFVYLEEGYHGDTLGAISVGYVQQFHHFFDHVIRRAHMAPSPHCPCCASEKQDDHCAMKAFEGMEALVREHHKSLAAVIVEPLCQGAAGMRIYPAHYLQRLRALCDEHDIFLIADEIAVGFGRTGAMFACEKAGIVPDILCLGKALTGGYLPMSAALVTDRIYNGFRSDGDGDRTFYDGHTFCGNPITAALALETLHVFEDEKILEQIQPRTRQMAMCFTELSAREEIHYAKTLGMIGMCAVKDEAGGAARARRVAEKALDLGLFIRPLGNILYLWPPLTTTEGGLDQMVRILNRALAAT